MTSLQETADAADLHRQALEAFGPGATLAVPGMLTRAEYDAYVALRRATRVRIRNDGKLTGELFGCKRHGKPSKVPGIHIAPVIHPFMSSYCVPIPFHGLLDGLTYLVGVSHNPDFKKRAYGFLGSLPSLDEVWPSLADRVRPAAPGDDVYAFCVGRAEPISAELARKDEAEIRRRGRVPRHIQFR